ncbi:ADOP family duplicated permease [Paludibaculum fermentans]|uniref:ABC transporter permease n=1 Tax=Paludibaculum fermentans TaxID=1473598 RepID=A0A7S7NVN6_PALFE|nr:ADOP family duplicated permease [Paludibaculum fermentans]QOY90649.1 ABC transporter permease [Paludibaculum fermentans]
MSWTNELSNRFRYLLRRNRFDAELEDEILFHLEARADELEAEGMTRKNALLQARREFGSQARIQEDSRSFWHFQWLEDLLSDLRYGSRALIRNKTFALAAIFSLALGTGANTSVFSFTMEFLFSEPSVADPDTLAIARIGGRSHSPFPEYRFVRDAKIFAGLAGLRESEANWRNGNDTNRIHVLQVTDNYYQVTGTPLLMGRPIQPGERNTVVISHHFWQTRLNGNPDVLGRTLVLDGQPFLVTGVLTQVHRSLIGFGFSPDLSMPVLRDSTDVKFIARLHPGMTHPDALERLRHAADELDRVYPREGNEPRSRYLSIYGVHGLDRLTGEKFMPVVAFFGLLLVVVGLVLLVACANVASLSLARSASRRQELSIRLAIGASRGRVVRQLLAESLLLAGLSTAAGVGLNLMLTSAVSGMALPLPFPIRIYITPDWHLLVYSVVVAAGCALVSGVMPALAATRADVHTGLKEDARQASGGRWNLRNILVAGQLAITVVLLATGLLFLRNLNQATSMNPGFDVNSTIWANMRLVPERYAEPGRQAIAVQHALAQLRAVPGVQAATVTRVVPLNDSSDMRAPIITDASDKEPLLYINLNNVAPDYFRTLAIPLLDGREFNDADRAGSNPVAIINDELARSLFGQGRAVGHTIGWRDPGGQTIRRFQIVGVVAASKYRSLGEEDRSALYRPYFQNAELEPSVAFLIRATRKPEGLLREIDRTLAAIDSSAAIEVKPMSSALGLAFLPSRVGAALLGTMGALGLLLASLGLYGVLVYAVNRRVREIGIRMALGASPRQVLRMVFGQSLLLVGVGSAIGLALALLATQPLTMFLVPGVHPTDVSTYVTVVGILLAVAILATAGPAVRAVRVDPTTALRYE